MRSDVIAAVATPPGKGGVAIIRISGSGSLELADRIFRPISGRPLSFYPTRTAVYGYVINSKSEKVDDCLITLFNDGSSYTGEETAEISCHGGVLITRAVLRTVFEAGATPAEAGEFTRRAFLNGKLTLIDAEAIGNLLDAGTEAQLALASDGQRRLLNSHVDAIRKELTRLLGSLYARIDYPEEDLGELSSEQILSTLNAIRGRIQKLSSTYSTGRAISEGITVSLVGRPNAGKSSLYNLILGEDRAIVTDLAGTTRDVLEAKTSIGKVAVRLFDTAGIRPLADADTVEQIGISRAEQRLRQSDLIIALFDGSSPRSKEDDLLISALGEARGVKLCLINKSDLPRCFDSSTLPDVFCRTAEVSVTDEPHRVLELIQSEVEERFIDGEISMDTDPIVSSLRQQAELTRAGELIDSAILAINEGMPPDCASSDIELALGAIGQIDGRAVSEAVVEDIFSRFCVGK